MPLVYFAQSFASMTDCEMRIAQKFGPHMVQKWSSFLWLST